MTTETFSIEESKGVLKFLLETARSQNRQFTPEESKLYDSIVNQLKAVAPDVNGRKTENSMPHLPRTAAAMPTGKLYRDGNNKIQAYCATDKFCTSRELADEDLGAYFRAKLLGDKDKLPRSFRNEIGADSSILLPTELSQKVWDLARSASVVSKAGAQTIPMHTSVMKLITLEDDVQPVWRGITPWTQVKLQQPGFQSVELKLYSIGALCGISFELLEDSLSAERAITTAMQNAVATALDQAVLGFSTTGAAAGVDRPVGICDSAANVFEIPALPIGIGDYSLPVLGIRHILSNNYPNPVDNISWLLNPVMATTYAMLQAQGSGQYLEPPPFMKGIRQLYTTTLTNGETSDSPSSPLFQSVYGDLSEAVAIGVRPTGVSFDTSKWGEAVGASNNEEFSATSGFGFLLRIYTRIAVALVRPGWLAKSTGELAYIYQAPQS